MNMRKNLPYVSTIAKREAEPLERFSQNRDPLSKNHPISMLPYTTYNRCPHSLPYLILFLGHVDKVEVLKMAANILIICSQDTDPFAA